MKIEVHLPHLRLARKRYGQVYETKRSDKRTSNQATRQFLN